MQNTLTLKQRIILKMYELSEEELVQLNNLIVGDNDWSNSGIYRNEKEFFNMFFKNSVEITKAKLEGDYLNRHKWVKFGAFGEIQSFEKMHAQMLPQIAGDIPTYIENHFEQFKDLLKL